MHSVGFQSVLRQRVTFLQVKNCQWFQGFCQTSLPAPHFYSSEALVDGIIIPYLSLSVLSKFAEFNIIIQLANEDFELYQLQHQPSRSYRGFILKFYIFLGFPKFAVWDKMNTLWHHKSQFNIKKCATNLWVDQVWRGSERKKYLDNSIFWSTLAIRDAVVFI